MRRNDEERKNRAALLLERKKITFNLVLLLAASFVVLLAVITAAWFANNRTVTAENAPVSVADRGFELASSGSTVRHSTYWPNADANYDNGADGSGQVYGTNETVSYKATGGTVHQVKQWLTSDNPDEAVEPGSWGSMTFYVIPKTDGDLNIRFTLDVRGFYEEDDNSLVDISALDQENNHGLTNSQILDCQGAQRYLQGHIFFFQTLGDPEAQTNAYYFKDPIEDGSFTYLITDAVAGKLYPVTIYWMWPETIGQLVLKDDTSHLREGIPLVEDLTGSETGDTDKSTVIDMVKANKVKIFKSESASDEHVNDMIDAADNASNYSLLDDWYNKADQIIGVQVDYFLMEVTATLEN
ncbi:MAG: hypothetical protein IJL09_05440 [Lachnospiraceae bacterium]|nr:hypothetical protein [Lachnospiraceae bacterium]